MEIVAVVFGATLCGFFIRYMFINNLGILQSFLLGILLAVLVDIFIFSLNDFSVGKASRNQLYIIWLAFPIFMGFFFAGSAFNQMLKRMEDGDD